MIIILKFEPWYFKIKMEFLKFLSFCIYFCILKFLYLKISKKIKFDIEYMFLFILFKAP